MQLLSKNNRYRQVFKQAVTLLGITKTMNIFFLEIDDKKFQQFYLVKLSEIFLNAVHFCANYLLKILTSNLKIVLAKLLKNVTQMSFKSKICFSKVFLASMYYISLLDPKRHYHVKYFASHYYTAHTCCFDVKITTFSRKKSTLP